MVHVIAWCHQAESHYLNQWSISLYDVTRSQWVNDWDHLDISQNVTDPPFPKVIRSMFHFAVMPTKAYPAIKLHCVSQQACECQMVMRYERTHVLLDIDQSPVCLTLLDKQPRRHQGNGVDIPLTYWGRDKMAAVSQTTLSNAFSWVKIFEFRLRFHWSLFLRVQLTIFQHWFR